MKRALHLLLILTCLTSCKNVEMRRAENYMADLFDRYLTGEEEVSEQQFTYFSNYILQNNGSHELKAMAYALRANLFYRDSPDEQTDWIDNMARGCLELEKANNNLLTASIYLDYGVELNRLGWYETAIPILEKALSAAEASGAAQHQIIAMMNLARANLHLPGGNRDPIKAVGYAEKATEIARENHLSTHVAKALYALSSCFTEIGMYNRALETAQESSRLMQEQHDMGIRKEPVRYYQVARSYFYLHQPDSALKYATMELEVCEDRVKASDYRLISQIYGELLGDYAMSTYYLGEYSKHVSTHPSSQTERLVLDRLELAEELAGKKSRSMSWYFIAIIAVVVLGSFLIYRKYRRHIKEKEAELAHKQHLLTESETNKEALRGKLADSDPLIAQLRANPRFLSPEEWKKLISITDKMYDEYCTALADQGFTANNIRLATAVKLGFSTADCSKLLGISPTSITKAKQRLKAKLS